MCEYTHASHKPLIFKLTKKKKKLPPWWNFKKGFCFLIDSHTQPSKNIFLHQHIIVLLPGAMWLIWTDQLDLMFFRRTSSPLKKPGNPQHVSCGDAAGLNCGHLFREAPVEKCFLDVKSPPRLQCRASFAGSSHIMDVMCASGLPEANRGGHGAGSTGKRGGNSWKHRHHLQKLKLRQRSLAGVKLT